MSVNSANYFIGEEFAVGFVQTPKEHNYQMRENPLSFKIAQF
jgi:hypothetical protein